MVSEVGSTQSQRGFLCGSCDIKQILVFQSACDRKVKCVFGRNKPAKRVSAVNRVLFAVISES